MLLIDAHQVKIEDADACRLFQLMVTTLARENF